jgi:hypothetical protein
MRIDLSRFQLRFLSQNDGVLFGLPVVMDTRDDSVAVGDKILLTYQVRSETCLGAHAVQPCK